MEQRLAQDTVSAKYCDRGMRLPTIFPYIQRLFSLQSSRWRGLSMAVEV